MAKRLGLVGVLFGVCSVTACSSDGGNAAGSGGSAGSAMGVAGNGGGGVSAAGSGGAPGVAGSSGAGGAGGATAPWMGTGYACKTFAMAPADAPHGLTAIYQNAPRDGFFDVGTRVLTVRNNLIYVRESDKLKSITLDGTVQDLGAAPAGKPDVEGDYWVYTESSTTEQGKLDYWVAPFDKPEQKTQLPSTEAGLGGVLGEGRLFWEKTAPHAIWSAPLTGGPGAELVPNGQPTGMIVDGGFLYFTDFVSSKLERVPVAGGAREPLITVTFGGNMTAGFGSLFWIGPTGNLSRYQPGKEEESLGSDVHNVLPVMGGVYFGAGSEPCRELYYVGPDSKAKQLLLSGFDGLSVLVAATDTHLYVQDMHAIYRVNR